jgi:hypothetical protein
LIRKLLVIEQTERLGAGVAGNSNDMSALKSHPFFEGINFSQLYSKKAPIVITTIKASRMEKLASNTPPTCKN